MGATDQAPVRLFSDRSHYGREHRAELSGLLRPFWKDQPFDEQQREQMYGLSPRDFILVDHPAQADLAVLPMTWNHYRIRRWLDRAADFIRAARRANLPVLSYVSGDEGVAVPSGFEDIWVARASGCRSRCRKRQIAQPVFFDDPLKTYPEFEAYDGASVAARKPVVGFCGQASVNPFKLASDIIRGLFRNVAFYGGWRQREPQPLYPPALLRARALRSLRQSPLVQSRFVIRSRYRAGAAGAESREHTTRDFYANIAATDYTLCVRGGGNFSKRFYEALALGRVPVLVDTDCLLPLESRLPWDEFIVRITPDALSTLPQRIAAHFAQNDRQGLSDRKRRCRELWLESLTFGGFHRKVARHLLACTAPARFAAAGSEDAGVPCAGNIGNA